MSMYIDKAVQRVQNLKQSDQYREFRTINRICGDYPTAWLNDDRNKKVTVWCSNDYLGMGEHPALRKIAHEIIEEYGVGSGGSRNISGTHLWLKTLENSLAKWHEKEAALVYTTGYVANDSSIQCLVKAFDGDCIVYSDELNHASIISGIRNSKCEKAVFGHNDVAQLEQMLAAQPLNRPKIIAFESIYSMDGDFSPIKTIVELAEKYNALTFLDEVHAVGIYGPQGAGVASMLGLQNRIDIIQGTMGKAIGSIGGYVTGKAVMIDLIRSFSAGFIFTTTLPPLIAASAFTSVEHFKRCSTERDKLASNSKKVRQALSERKIPIMNQDDSHIIPILVGDMVKCKAASQYLLDEYKIYIQPINFPSVASGTERFRINATPQHTDEHIAALADAISAIYDKFEIPLAK